jgi:hypothetical protein
MTRNKTTKPQGFSKVSAKLKHCNTDVWAAILFSATLPFCLTGCMGVYEGGFECPPSKGVGCKSISEVNDMVNQCSMPSAQCPVPSLQRARNKQETSTEQSHFAPKEQSEQVSSEHRVLNTKPHIWYSPWFDNGQEVKKKAKVLNDAI